MENKQLTNANIDELHSTRLSSFDSSLKIVGEARKTIKDISAIRIVPKTTKFSKDTIRLFISDICGVFWKSFKVNKPQDIATTDRKRPRLHNIELAVKSGVPSKNMFFFNKKTSKKMTEVKARTPDTM